MKVNSINNYSLSTVNKTQNKTNSKPNFKGYFKDYEISRSMYTTRYIFPENDYMYSGYDVNNLIERYCQLTNRKVDWIEHTRCSGQNRIYFADPMEEVSAEKRKNASYIVYEKEPEYPILDGRVSRSYFDKDDTNYAEQYAHIRDFYKGYENSAIRNIELNRQKILQDNDAVPEAYGKMKYFEEKLPEIREKLKIAQGCLDVYEKGALLRLERGRMFHLIDKTSDDKGYEERKLSEEKSKYNRLLKERDEIVNKISLSKTKLERIKEIKELDEKIHESDRGVGKKDYTSPYSREIVELNNKIKEYEAKKNGLESSIKIQKSFIDKLPAKISSLDKIISDCRSRIKELEKAMVPLYHELKRYYATHKIPIIIIR